MCNLCLVQTNTTITQVRVHEHSTCTCMHKRLVNSPTYHFYNTTFTTHINLGGEYIRSWSTSPELNELGEITGHVSDVIRTVTDAGHHLLHSLRVESSLLLRYSPTKFLINCPVEISTAIHAPVDTLRFRD